MRKVNYASKIVIYQDFQVIVPDWTYALTLTRTKERGVFEITAWGALPTWDPEYDCWHGGNSKKHFIGTVSYPHKGHVKETVEVVK